MNKKISSAFFSVMCVLGASSQAATISVFDTNLAFHEAAFYSSLTLGSSLTEDFDSFTPVDAQYQRYNAQNSWLVSSNSINTSVGVFTNTIAGQAGKNTNSNNLMIESEITGEHGRESLASSASDYWLDNNDASQVQWDIVGNGLFNSIGFFLSDVNDINARLNFMFGQDTQLNTGTRYADAKVIFVTITDFAAVNSASLIFENCKNVACASLSGSDGWGIDDITLGLTQTSLAAGPLNFANQVPIKETGLLVVAGLASIFYIRKRKLLSRN